MLDWMKSNDVEYIQRKEPSTEKTGVTGGFHLGPDSQNFLRIS